MNDLTHFVRESNKIEGILREPTEAEIMAHTVLLAEGPMSLDISALEAFVAVVAPRKLLRVRAGMNVFVGSHIAPPGGPEIADALCDILVEACEGGDPYTVHQKYEHLHPFMDGNGRSGRALWLWMMKQHKHGYERAIMLGFLHAWYYQSLAGWRARA